MAESRPWTDEEHVRLVEYAVTVTKLLDRSIGECAVELARIVRAYRRQQKDRTSETE